jgi:cation transport regulator ChaC
MRRAKVGLALGLVDGGVRRGVDDRVRPHRAHGRGQGGRVREVGPERPGAVEVERHHLAERRERALQLPAHLAVLAEKEKFQAAPDDDRLAPMPSRAA